MLTAIHIRLEQAESVGMIISISSLSFTGCTVSECGGAELYLYV